MGAILLGGFSPLSGQSYPIRIYTEADGLSNSSVFDVVEAPDGLLWFATRGGVCVYDGTVWRRFGLEDGLPRSGFLRLAISEAGVVWAWNHGQRRLFERRDGEWTKLPVLLGREWRPGDFTELALLGGGERQVPVVGTMVGLFVWRGDGWRRHDLGSVRALAPRAGELFVASEEGLFVLGGADQELRPLQLGGDIGETAMHGMAADGDGLWLAGDAGLARYAAGRLELLVDDLPRLDQRPGQVRLEPDGRGGVYIADRQTLLHFSDEQEMSSLELRHGFAAAGATSLLVGRDGVLWAGSERGVSKLVSRRFASFTKVDGLYDNEVSAILEKQPGVVLFGHNGGLTELVDGRPARSLALPKQGAVNARVMDLVEHRGDIWVLTSDSGLWLLPGGELDELRRIGGHDGNRLPEALAGGVVDGAGRLWIGGTGLARLAGDRFQKVALPVEPLNIRRLLAGPEGQIYAATARRGLLIWEHGRWAIATRSDGLAPSLFTVNLWRGRVWVGADEGLFFLDDGRLVKARRPRVERPVYALLAGPDGRLWIGTDYGVIHFDGTTSRWFGPSDGLAGSETNRAGLTVDHASKVWIGTASGASRYDRRYDEVPGPPMPRIDGVLAAGRLDALEAPISLPWHGNQLTFRFRATAFIDEEHVEYSGRLVGFDEDFQPPARAVGGRMHYTNLPPGDYSFEVRARRRVAWGEAPWSEIVHSPAIHIARPWWTTPVFYLAVAALSLLLVGTALLQIAQRRHRRQLESLVGERTKELSSANERLRGEIEGHHRTESRLRRAREAAEEASLAKSRFLAVMSHEIRTPMTGVLGVVDLLERGPLEDGQRQRIETLRRAGQALLAILDDILDYSRLETGSFELLREPLSIRALLEEVMALFASQAAEKGLDLQLEMDADLPENVLGDVTRLRQVLVNLTGNAVKFTHAGEVGLEARWRQGELLLRVRDTGIGIAEEHQATLFGPFQQVDSSAHRSYGGTGLGLAICRRLVAAMQGEIELSSRVGEGSAFTVRLPAEVCPQAPERAAPVSEAQGNGDLAALHILVAEDNPMVQRLTLEMLEALGYRADLAENGAEVLEALERRSYDLVLMDVQMPMLDGLEATRRIRARWPQEGPRIIAVTAHALRGDRENCLEAGMDDYLSKPVTLAELDEKISHWAARL